ncbi:MAG: hypothetical protein LN413_03495 [Candidatus Thermoplasmatota archaeon]|nr:hypothetical protein [Candidatus Thermoplasmatota archaeon]
MEWEEGPVLRRAIHIASPVFLAYYLLPDDLGIGVPKLLVAAILWLVTLVIELLRLLGHLEILGIREYERGQISAYFWGGTGLFLGLVLFPPVFVVVAMFGMAWIDPLSALTRRRGGYPWVPLVAYLALATVGLSLLTPFRFPAVLALALIAAVVAIAAEYPRLRWIDDDFTMFMAPLIALTAVGALLQNLELAVPAGA